MVLSGSLGGIEKSAPEILRRTRVLFLSGFVLESGGDHEFYA